MRRLAVCLALLVISAFAVLFVTSTDPADDARLRIAFPALQADGANRVLPPLADAARSSLMLNLTLLGDYRLIPETADIGDVAAARLYAEANQVDKVILGSVVAQQASGYAVTLSLYDRVQGRVILTETRTAASAFSVMAAIDELSRAFLDGLAGRHIGYGGLRLTRNGIEASYRVFLNDTLAGTDLTDIRQAVAGQYTLRIAQDGRMFGSQNVYSGPVEIVEGQTADVSFDIPPLLEAERQELRDTMIQIEDLAVAGRWDDVLKSRLDRALAAAYEGPELVAARNLLVAIDVVKQTAPLRESLIAGIASGNNRTILDAIPASATLCRRIDEMTTPDLTTTPGMTDAERVNRLRRNTALQQAVRNIAYLSGTVAYHMAIEQLPGAYLVPGKLTVANSILNSISTTLSTPNYIHSGFSSRVQRALVFIGTIRRGLSSDTLSYSEYMTSLSAEFGEATITRHVASLSVPVTEGGLLVLSDTLQPGISINRTDYGSAPVFIHTPQGMTSANITAAGPPGMYPYSSTFSIVPGRLNICFLPIPIWNIGTARPMALGWEGPTPTSMTDPAVIIEDFETGELVGQIPARNALGMDWWIDSGDANRSNTGQLHAVIASNGAPYGSNYLSCTTDFVYPNDRGGWRGASLNLSSLINLNTWARGNHGVRFFCRGHNAAPAQIEYFVGLNAPVATDGSAYGCRFVVREEWTQVTIPFSQFYARGRIAGSIPITDYIGRSTSLGFAILTYSDINATVRGCTLDIDNIDNIEIF